jgi:hypothetical protein
VTTKIYALHDGNGAVRYIGKTRLSLSRRLAGHLHDTKRGNKSKKSRWIQGMISVGKFPEIILIGEVPGNGNQEEIAWIDYGRSLGWELTNGTDGGGVKKEFPLSDKCVVSFWVEPTMLKVIDAKAKELDRSRSWMICELLSQTLGHTS